MTPEERLEQVKFSLETGGHVTYEDRRWLISEVERLRAQEDRAHRVLTGLGSAASDVVAQLATARDAALEEAAKVIERLRDKLDHEQELGQQLRAILFVATEDVRSLKTKPSGGGA